VRLFIDECLSPTLARRLSESGAHDAVHPLDVGRRGESDHGIVERCVADDRIIVTGNARDFRRLLGIVELHPGLIILPAVCGSARHPRTLSQRASVRADKKARVVVGRCGDGGSRVYPTRSTSAARGWRAHRPRLASRCGGPAHEAMDGAFLAGKTGVWD
jgi:predicted nuclease of predicted toxin-antitoxin system